MKKTRIWVIGVHPGCKKLDLDTQRIIGEAKMVFASERHRPLVVNIAHDILPLDGKISEIAANLAGDPSANAVFLASGDPAFFGIAALLLKKFGPGEVVIRPAVSSMQVAFALAGLSWSDARLASLHGRDLQELAQVLGAPKVGLFTDSVNTPSRIARFLLQTGWDDLEMIVCSDLGQPEESVMRGLVEDFVDWEGSDLNVVILVQGDADPRPLGPGIPETMFASEGGKITKSAVRAVIMGLLELPRGKAVLWDVGAGSGSVGIEAALLNPSIQVWSVEKEQSALENIRENRKRFRTAGVWIANGPAPDALDGLPPPDRVFVGGSNGALPYILYKSFSRLKEGGIVVVSAVLSETFAEAIMWAKENGKDCEWVDLSFSRSRKVGEGNIRAAENPVILVKIKNRKD
ncbi:precorrin-6y C5,15-methyltransferase (decarboxylating) subunit CbiE [bacterium]|nr:MAG: precorrin-6y C5,15-methyltransferase (decarboxylating) subunit CbiE [bacterium]